MKSSILRFIFSRSGSRHNINMQLTDIVDKQLNSSLRMENILIEEFLRANIDSYSSNDESLSNFNLYLILNGLLVTLIIAMQTLSYQSFSGNVINTIGILLDVISVLLLVLSGIVSFLFLKRFITLAYKEFKSTNIMNKIKDFYIIEFKDQLPIIKELLSRQEATLDVIGIPSHIRYVVSCFGSACFAGASFITYNYIYSFFTNTSIIAPLYHNEFVTYILLCIAITLIIFVVSFTTYQFYYKNKISELTANS